MEGTIRPSMCHVHTQEAIEEGLEVSTPPPPPLSTKDRTSPDGGENIDDLPWHHAQLAMLYGRQAADDIVHPKMERKQVTIDPNIKPDSHVGAAQLWSMLRNESKGKLLQEDQKIAEGLKESYGAFVRQLVLQKGEVPVKRNFYEKEDVPDMDHLLDKKKLLRTMDVRHKIELMGRSSKLNQDKTNILLYNNPLPDLMNASGEEGIDRYLPTWLEHDEESIASYRKWLSDEREESSPLKPSDSLIELVRPITRDTSRHYGPPRVTFLTELEAGAERGQFSDKYKAKKDSENSVTNPEENKPSIVTAPVELRPFRGDEVKSAQDSKKKEKQDPTWQPLTLNALVEYSDKRNTIGAGQFRNGSMKMYPISSADSSAS